MKRRTLGIGSIVGSLVLVQAVFAASAFAAGIDDDCRMTPPSAMAPDKTMSDNAQDETTTNSLTERLTTCGSVLDPPAVGDPDIVEPTPHVGDEINVHPDAPAVRP